MFFRQVLYRDLGCASYVLADGGEAIVVDPRWDIDEYLEIAATERVRIAHVIDTHEHADHVSGRLRLAQATGACAHQPAGEHAAGPGRIAAGDTITVGPLRLTAIAAGGHRPEHLAFAVSDLSRGEEPWMVLSGDSLLVGDIARPDLAVDAQEGAQGLHASLRRLLALGDDVELWPAHIGGSLCGGAGLSGKSSSTIGYERRHNPLLEMDEPEFVAALTTGLPSRPPNIERIVSLNRRDAGPLPSQPMQLDAAALRELGERVTVIDSRHPDLFDAGHLVGAINLPVASAGAGTRAGWALDPAQPIMIVARDLAEGARMAAALQAVGFWDLAGIAVADAEAWTREGLEMATARAWDVAQLADGLWDGTVDLVDVREPSEWNAGHVPGSQHIPLSRLRDLAELAPAGDERTIAVACAAGMRAAFAASLLRRAGRPDVVRVSGGGIEDLRPLGLELSAA